jgi:hypothetical protein
LPGNVQVHHFVAVGGRIQAAQPEKVQRRGKQHEGNPEHVLAGWLGLQQRRGVRVVRSRVLLWWGGRAMHSVVRGGQPDGCSVA